MKWKTSSEKNLILYGHKWSHHDVIQSEPTMRRLVSGPSVIWYITHMAITIIIILLPGPVSKMQIVCA